MAEEPFGFDRDDVDRFLSSAGNQLRSMFEQFARSTDGPSNRGGWPAFFEQFTGRSAGAQEPPTTGQTGSGVWAIYTVDDDGGAQVEQVYATEIDALRANKYNTDNRRRVRFLPYGIPVSVLDGPDSASEGVTESA